MVRRVGKDGGVWHEPPYTWDEEMDFYGRVGGGPVAILHAPKPAAAKSPKSPKPPRKE
jgi:hypothetical protein